MMYRRLAFINLVIALAVTALPSTALAAEFGGIGIRPGPAVSSRTAGSFHYDARPGTDMSDSLLVINTAQTSKRVHIIATKGHVTPDNHFWCEQLADMASWILPKDTISDYMPGQNSVLPFTVRIPATAQPGEYDACLVATEEHTEVSGAKQAIRLQSRVAQRVTVTLPGTMNFDYGLSEPTLQVLSDQLVVSATLSSSAPVSLSVTSSARLSGAHVSAHQILLPRSRQELRLHRITRPYWGGWYALRIDSTAVPTSPAMKIHANAMHRSQTIRVFLWPAKAAIVDIVAVMIVGVSLVVLAKRTAKRKQYRLQRR
ncbi:MAG: hypothetical protein JWM37_879 [Candidatus Saccharibacteria bacterium]|nr:hypothetical protein [Candidatus Saccharibacteria bacterium]